MKRFLNLIAVLCAVTLLCAGCAMYQQDYRVDVQEYAMIAQPGDLSKLDEYPNLTYVDLRGSTCYDEILEYIDANPKVTVRYNVQLGQKRFNQDISDVTLNGYEVTYESLAKNLKYLPVVNTVHIDQIEMNAQEMDDLQAAYPEIAFTYTVELAGHRYDHTVSEVDLARMMPSEVNKAVERLALLPNLTDLMLMDGNGESRLALSDVKIMVDAFPEANFHYVVNLFGNVISLTDEDLVFDSVKVGNEGITEIRNVLDLMNHCTYVKLDSCEVDNEVMAQLRNDYPEKNVVWRVFTDKYSMLTDEEMLRMPNSLTDKDAAALQYCNQVKYLDVSNSKITNLSFVEYMPQLECATLSVTRIKDLSPLINCPNLVWLEVTNCSGIKDLSPLSSLSNLKYLNISTTKVADIAPLYDLNLERFKCARTNVPKKDIEAFASSHPDCVTTNSGSSLGRGWRYEDANQKVIFPYYEQLVKIFRYNEKGYKGNHKE